MHLVYIDDSRDYPNAIVFSALVLPAERWREALNLVREYRRDLSRRYGVYFYEELHACEFVAGRGNIARKVITKYQRGVIFRETVQFVCNLPEARLFNAVFPCNRADWAFERMLNRINRTMKELDSKAILICDEGNEGGYTRMVRKMGTFNPIPSHYGIWTGTGNTHKNIPLEFIVEDPFFKDSKQSFFIQLVDFIAYALLRRECPLPSKSRYGIDNVFNCLAPILVREASRYDPEGIIRP